MRVLHVSPYPTTHDARFMSAMLAAGVSVAYLPLDTARPAPFGWPNSVECIAWQGLPAESHLDPVAILSALPSFRKATYGVAHDILQAGPACSAGFLAALAARRPFISMLWGHDILMDVNKDRILEAMAAIALRSADRVLADCNAVREAAKRIGEVDDSRFIQFPWGVELGRFFPPPAAAAIRDDLKWNSNFVFASARSLGPLYGVETLLEGFRIAHGLNAGLRLLLFGDGPLRTMVENFLSTHRMSDCVHLAGRINESEMASALQCGDAYVSCSITDGSSVTLLEAMALGVPSLVSDIPGNREWVNDRTGRLFCVNNPMRLAEGMLDLARMSVSARRKLGAESRRQVRSRANFAINAQQLWDAHSALLLQNPQSGS